MSQDNNTSNPTSIKEAIKQEFVKCATDPAYFMRKYYMIQHPKRGRIQFALYPFQEKVLHQFKKNEYTIINKSRQLGISTLSSAYALWLMLFHRDKNVLAIATKQETAKNIVTKIRFAYQALPNWLKIKTIEDNRLSLRLDNGSQVKAVAASPDAGRSEAVSLLILDEAAFIDNIDVIFTAAQQTLATGGQCIALSTPNGTGNWFHQTFTKAEMGENKFVPLRLPWTVHPERNQKWRDEQDIILGLRNAAQECDCDFSTSGQTVLEPDVLNWIEQNTIEEPIERRGMDGNLWIWEPPDYSKSYAVVADVARGDGSDFSAFHIIDIETVTQVAEYKGQIDTRDYGNLLVGIATEYNDALLVIENANIGWDVVQTAIERGYRNLYYSPTSDVALTNVEMYLNRFDTGNGMVPGFTTSLKTRPLAISKMISYITERSCIIKSKRTLEELRTFIWKNGKAQAMSSYNDDLTMALSIALFLRDTALRFRQTGQDLARAAMDGMGKTSSNGFQIYSPGNANNQNPWIQENPYGGHEDIKWLL
jgi:hypothetical protein